MRPLPSELRSARRLLTMGIEEARALADEHRLAWQRLAREHADTSPATLTFEPFIERSRRSEAYYRGQVTALTHALRWLDAALEEHEGQLTVCNVSSSPTATADVVLIEELAKPRLFQGTLIDEHRHAFVSPAPRG